MSSDDKRKAQRHRTLKGAKILLPGNFSLFECTVRNLSPTGAQLELASTLGIPNSFRLKLDDKGDVHSCRVAWRTATRLGVEFGPEPEVAI